MAQGLLRKEVGSSAMRLVRLVFAVYCLFVSLLLLVPDPLTLLGIEGLSVPGGGRGVHFLLFALLAL